MPTTNEVKAVIEKGELEQITVFLDKFPEVVHQVFVDLEETQESSTALLMAISTAQIEKIELLLARGADIHQQPVNAAECYLNSSRHIHPDMLRLFVKLGIIFNDPYSASSPVLKSLNVVYRDDDIVTFNLFLKLGFDPIEFDKQREKQPSHANVTRSNMHEYCYLLEVALSFLGGYKAKPRIVSKLLKLGCKTHIFNKKYSIIDYALYKRAYRFMEALLDAKVPPVLSSHYTFMEGLIHQHKEMPVELRDRLITDEMNFKQTDHDGLTLLHLSAINENEEIMPLLIAKGVDINAKNKRGETALHCCVDHNAKVGIKACIKLGADLNILNNSGETALDKALSVSEFKRMRALMIKAGAKKALELSGSNLNTPTSPLLLIQQSVTIDEPWADTFLDKLTELTTEELACWHTFIQHCLDNNASKPSKKWTKIANELLDRMGINLFKDYMSLLLPLVKEPRTKVIEYDHDQDNYREANRVDFISEVNTRILKGMLWACSRFDDAVFSRILRQLAEDMYKKIYGIGMRNAKLGNAAIYSLSQMQGIVGIKEIVVLRAATKYNPALTNINRVFDKVAADLEMTPDELAAISIPDYNLTDIAYYECEVGDYTAQVTLVATGKTELLWKKGEKVQKTVPAIVKKDHPTTIKRLKSTIKELQVASRAHSLRIEQQYLKKTIIQYASWKENYVDHKLIGFLARRLIWRMRVNRKKVDVMYSATIDGYVDANNNEITIPSNASMTLWHPSMSSANEVLAWRDWLIQEEVMQPFKQAHREVYCLTDAERTTEDHSLRFANHILNHGQFNALATQRGWRQVKGGSWCGGSENSAYKSVQGLDITLTAEGLDQYGYSDNGMYACVATSSVTFHKRHQVIKLEKIDPLLFSEVMRDIDLFVGVSSVGNDPDWAERTSNNYWQDTSFGVLSTTATTRFDVLTALIPKLKISPQLTLEGRFLKVAGKLRTYKIHLGSANILMEPNDSYLCIVGTRERQTVMLPFEGDRTLSMILSKAMLLAADDKIKDQTIVSQINR